VALYGSVLYGSALYGSGGSTGGTFASLGVVSLVEHGDFYVLDDVVPLAWLVTDRDGEPAAPTTVTLTVTLDGGAPEAVVTTSPTLGEILAAYRPTVPGAYTTRLVLDGDHAGASEDRFIVTALDPWALDLTALRAYLLDTSATDAEILDALGAERAAQVARCRVEPYTPDLLQALKRRVARNLAARRVPVATFTAFDGGQTSQRVPQHDAEIRRLEAPHRKRPVG
jgi:hypothetical protein